MSLEKLSRQLERGRSGHLFFLCCRNNPEENEQRFLKAQEVCRRGRLTEIKTPWRQSLGRLWPPTSYPVIHKVEKGIKSVMAPLTWRTCSLLVEEMLDSASSVRSILSVLTLPSSCCCCRWLCWCGGLPSSIFVFQKRPSFRKLWYTSSSSHAFFQPLLRFTCSCCTLTLMSWMFSEGIHALQANKEEQPLRLTGFKLYSTSV